MGTYETSYCRIYSKKNSRLHVQLCCIPYEFVSHYSPIIRSYLDIQILYSLQDIITSRIDGMLSFYLIRIISNYSIIILYHLDTQLVYRYFCSPPVARGQSVCDTRIKYIAYPAMSGRT